MEGLCPPPVPPVAASPSAAGSPPPPCCFRLPIAGVGEPWEPGGFTAATMRRGGFVGLGFIVEADKWAVMGFYVDVVGFGQFLKVGLSDGRPAEECRADDVTWGRGR